MPWRLDEWTGISKIEKPMSHEDIKNATKYLRENHYPIPEDCLKDKCQGYRVACSVACYVAMRLCGDV